MAPLMLKTIAPPTAWITRKITSWASVADSPQARDPSVNNACPAVIVHWERATSTENDAAIVGRAMFTTLPCSYPTL